jgi:hypothetical protein
MSDGASDRALCRCTAVPVRGLRERQALEFCAVERLRRRIPDWLIGLILAIVITVALYVVFGAGDDPTLTGT